MDRRTARELVCASLGSDPFERIQRLGEAGERKAKAKALAYQMEHARKAVLAQEASRISRRHANEKLSEAKLDRLARASEAYLAHIDAAAEAIEEAERAASEYWAIQAALEWDAKTLAHVNALSKLQLP